MIISKIDVCQPPPIQLWKKKGKKGKTSRNPLSAHTLPLYTLYNSPLQPPSVNTILNTTTTTTKYGHIPAQT